MRGVRRRALHREDDPGAAGLFRERAAGPEGNPNAQAIRNLITVLQYVALLVAPLLFVGFSPPKFVRDRFGREEVGAGAKV